MPLNMVSAVAKGYTIARLRLGAGQHCGTRLVASCPAGMTKNARDSHILFSKVFLFHQTHPFPGIPYNPAKLPRFPAKYPRLPVKHPRLKTRYPRLPAGLSQQLTALPWLFPEPKL